MAFLLSECPPLSSQPPNERGGLFLKSGSSSVPLPPVPYVAQTSLLELKGGRNSKDKRSPAVGVAPHPRFLSQRFLMAPNKDWLSLIYGRTSSGHVALDHDLASYKIPLNLFQPRGGDSSLCENQICKPITSTLCVPLGKDIPPLWLCPQVPTGYWLS